MVLGAYIRAEDSKTGEELLSNARPDRICVPAEVSVSSQKINIRSRNDYELKANYSAMPCWISSTRSANDTLLFFAANKRCIK